MLSIFQYLRGRNVGCQQNKVLALKKSFSFPSSKLWAKTKNFSKVSGHILCFPQEWNKGAPKIDMFEIL